MEKTVEVIIVVEGGVVQSVFSNHSNVVVKILDNDELEANEDYWEEAEKLQVELDNMIQIL